MYYDDDRCEHHGGSSARDLKQMDEVTSEVMKDESMREEGPLVKQFMDLVTPGSGMIMGKFTRLRI